MKRITIFTPTYNREKMLRKLYDSLCAQSSKDFLWLVIDDGSSDGTGEFVRDVQKRDEISIEYIYQKNQGKYMAIQKGVEVCETPWFLCVDSDDTLSPMAVRQILADIDLTHGCNNVGVIYPQELRDDKSKKWVPETVKQMDVVDAKVLYGIKETAILLKTEYLKKLAFATFPGERFMSEEILYMQLAQHGKVIPRNVPFYLSEYQSEGLTKNLFEIWKRNPLGTILLLKERFAYSKRYSKWICLRERIKSILNLNALCMSCGKNIWENTPSKAFSFALYFPSLLWKRIRFGK